MALEYATVSSKGQLVIPARIRESMGIDAGTRISFREERGLLILRPETLAAKLRAIHELRGCTAGFPSGTEMLLEDRRLERKRELDEEGW